MDPVTDASHASIARTIVLPTAMEDCLHPLRDAVVDQGVDHCSERTETVRCDVDLDNDSVSSRRKKDSVYVVVRNKIESIAESNGLQRRDGMVFRPFNDCYFEPWKTYEEFLSWSHSVLSFV